jgi:hypothetical protein
MRRRLLAIFFDHLARHRARHRKCEHVPQVAVRLLEPDDQRVAVGRLQPGDRRVVVEFRAGLGARAELVEPDDLAGEKEGVRRAVLRIEEAADRVGEVLRRELALLPLERRIVGEVDALPYAEGIGKPVGGDLRHVGGARHELRRAREIVVGEQRVVDRLEHMAGVVIVDAHRIEARLGGLERDVQDLRFGLRRRHLRRHECDEREQAGGEAHGGESIIG